MFDSGLDTEQPFGQGIHMRRTYVRRRITAAVLAAVVIGIGAPAAARVVTGRPAQPPTRNYVVQPGDTLWDIAVATDPGNDPRSVIDHIVIANGLEGGDIVPGQSLVVPAG
jgi:LysM repeat protein